MNAGTAHGSITMTGNSDTLTSPSGGDDLLGGQPQSVGPGSMAIVHPFPRKGGSVQWASTLTMVLAVSLVVIALLTWLLERRNRRSPALGFLRLLGLGAIPLFMLPIGSFATFESSKRVEFCATCHTAMDPFVLDMKDEKSNTLAALHYKNRYIQEAECYQCHADYGVFGDASAKLTGLKHLQRWIERSATARGEEQIKHYGPYKNDVCLTCHAGSAKFLNAKDGVHRDIAADLASYDKATGAPTTPCLQCHGPAHPTLQEWKAKKGGA
jgi:trimethylamine-N-oxide reductase (cytochrome c), cytochrome c-type subunit TorC